MSITADQARLLQKQKMSFEVSIAKQLRQHIDVIIKNLVETPAPREEDKIQYCEYSIPPIILGRALYDVQAVKLHLLNILHKDGYQVYFHETNPLKIIISWAQPKKPKSKKGASKSLLKLKETSKKIIL
jgi:hypothetical protein